MSLSGDIPKGFGGRARKDERDAASESREANSAGYVPRVIAMS
jgi:hypothetical protein